ncbi:MAG: TolC family protein [Deltaproteobacteria bacterium]|nr:TolC family protein [Deltaproteobacteria bacterium]
MIISKQLRGTLLLIIFVLGGFIHVPAATAEDFDFTSAWQQLLKKSNSLRAEQANIDHAGYEHQAAKDLYFPQVNLSAGYIYLDDKIQLTPQAVLDSMPAGPILGTELAGLAQGIGLSPAELEHAFTSTITDREIRSSSLSLLWPLYTGGRITAAQDISEASVTEAKQQRILKLYSQFQTLSSRYFGVILVQQILTAQTEVEESLQIHLKHAKLMVENGQIAEVERLQAEASYDKARVDREKSASDLRIAEAALTRLLQEEMTVHPTTLLFINPNLPALETFIEKTLAGYPGLTILDAKKEMAAGLIKAETGKYLPEVALLGNYVLYEEDNLATELVPDWFVGLTVNVPLIDRSGRGGKRKAAKSLITKVEALRNQAREDLSLLVEKTYRQAEQAIAEYNGLASSLRLAEKTLEMRDKAFDQGLATSLDVVDARLYVAGVKTQRSHAAYTYVTKLAEILAVSGRLEDFKQFQKNAQ